MHASSYPGRHPCAASRRLVHLLWGLESFASMSQTPRTKRCLSPKARTNDTSHFCRHTAPTCVRACQSGCWRLAGRRTHNRHIMFCSYTAPLGRAPARAGAGGWRAGAAWMQVCSAPRASRAPPAGSSGTGWPPAGPGSARLPLSRMHAQLPGVQCEQARLPSTLQVPPGWACRPARHGSMVNPRQATSTGSSPARTAGRLRCCLHMQAAPCVDHRP